ncbi:metallophosphoesterase [Cerasicoccus frondis]|uniref:metallophosphoesterase n=1 Tax=Cerasicoccus frondis TaxID=490090 RepID=UPI002852D151|nr:metallophosphoesterase [Cerasicoccus frondis]
MGQASFERRWARENRRGADLEKFARRERLNRGLHGIIIKALEVTGLMIRARRNFSDIELVTRELEVRNLPPAFDGFCILQMSDLHIDLFPEALTPAILRVLENADYDLCVDTGDFMLRHNKWPVAKKEISQIAAAVSAPHYGVLGNHDSIKMAADLEALGIRLLLNEATPIRRGDDEIWLVGVDDPHYFQSHDLDRALAGVRAACAPTRPPIILLSHAPVLAPEAASGGRVDALLCGHTHGGQLCLPGGLPVVTHSRSSRLRVKGAWRIGDMEGYTSRGVGCSGVAARFNCRPEIVRHILRPKLCN